MQKTLGCLPQYRKIARAYNIAKQPFGLYTYIEIKIEI